MTNQKLLSFCTWALGLMTGWCAAIFSTLLVFCFVHYPNFNYHFFGLMAFALLDFAILIPLSKKVRKLTLVKFNILVSYLVFVLTAWFLCRTFCGNENIFIMEEYCHGVVTSRSGATIMQIAICKGVSFNRELLKCCCFLLGAVFILCLSSFYLLSEKVKEPERTSIISLFIYIFVLLISFVVGMYLSIF